MEEISALPVGSTAHDDATPGTRARVADFGRMVCDHRSQKSERSASTKSSVKRNWERCGKNFMYRGRPLRFSRPGRALYGTLGAFNLHICAT
jgi:hypothetical protein